MNRNLHLILILIIASVCSINLHATETDSTKVRFAYDVKFDMDFDNREFAKSSFSPSKTIFGARLTPSVGVEVDQPGNLTHRLMFGVDVMKDFGSSEDTPIFKEINFYYLLEKQAGKTGLSLQAGIFPRSSMEAYYSEAFFSDSSVCVQHSSGSTTTILKVFFSSSADPGHISNSAATGWASMA